MADEVYKILQSRLRRNAQQRTPNADCGDDCRKPNCHQKSSLISSATPSESESQSGHKRRRQTSTAGEDPQSHKIIEKRRRDRMNSCLADLSHLIPSNYLKKGRGRIEKTEIVEMAIKHIKYLHSILPDSAVQQEGNANETASQVSSADTSNDPVHFGRPTPLSWRYPDDEESFKNGFNECKSEALHFLVNSGGIQPESPICTRLVDYLKGYIDHRGSPKHCKTEQMGLDDSDYSSLRSGHSTTNSEVGSIVSNTSGSVVSNTSLSSSFFSQPNSSKYLPSTSDRSVKSSKSSSSSHHHHHQGHSTSVHPKSGASSSSEYPKSSGGYYQGNSNSSFSDHHSQSEKLRKSSEDMSSGKFKFKDSIRERYVAAADEPESALLASQKEEKYAELKHSRSDTNVETKDEKTTYPPVGIDWPKEMKKGSIPTFALHGSHYIPVPVAEEVIQPYIHLFESGSPDAPLMLHPITIPVNFCGPIQMAANAKSTKPPSSSSSSKGSHSSSGSKRIKDDKD